MKKLELLEIIPVINYGKLVIWVLVYFEMNL